MMTPDEKRFLEEISNYWQDETKPVSIRMAAFHVGWLVGLAERLECAVKSLQRPIVLSDLEPKKGGPHGPD